MSREREAFALILMREMPVKKAGEILGETDHKLWRRLFAHVDAAWAELSWANVVWVGADEMNRRKGHKFHVVSQGVEAVEAVRRNEVRQDAQAREQLAKTCWLWRKNPEGWTDREASRWEQVQGKPRVTGLAYAVRLELQRAYAAPTATQARRRFQEWGPWVQTEAHNRASGLLEPRRKAAPMVARHLEGILAHWKQGLTTACLEGLNRWFSATKRKARGYRSSEDEIARLYFVAGKLEIPPLSVPIMDADEAQKQNPCPSVRLFVWGSPIVLHRPMVVSQGGTNAQREGRGQELS